MTASATLLLLADGRTPTGGHAHSGGLEAAVRARAVHDPATLSSWLRGRLETVGRVDAAFAAAWWATAQAANQAGSGPAGSRWSVLTDEYWARTPSTALRATSRAQARGLLRAGRAMWPDGVAVPAALATPGGAPAVMASAAVASDAGIGLADLTLVVATSAVTGPAWAATRLLGIDPYAVARCLADLAAPIEAVAADARPWGGEGVDPAALPAASAPLLDIGAEYHTTWEVRLFAS